MATRRSTLKGAASLAATAVLGGCASEVTTDSEATVTAIVNNNSEERKTVTLWVVRDSELVLDDTVSTPPDGVESFDGKMDAATVATWRVMAQVADGPTIAREFREGRFDQIQVIFNSTEVKIETHTYG